MKRALPSVECVQGLSRGLVRLECSVYLNMKKIAQKLKKSASTAKETVSGKVKKATTTAKDSSAKIQEAIQRVIPEAVTFLSNEELLKWSESITKGATTIYDKALDSNYLATRIGGGNHRMFDGGHDLLSALKAAQEASDNDSLQEEVIGYVSAIWKDVTTTKGLPFVTWSKDDYDVCAQWVKDNVPGASKEWFYDLCSFDVFEVLSASLGVVSVVFSLTEEDNKRLAEILGNLGVVGITSANLFLGLIVVFVTAYAYFYKKHNLNNKAMFSSAGKTAFKVFLYRVLGWPILMELVLVLVVTKLLKRNIPDGQQLLEFVRVKLTKMELSFEFGSKLRSMDNPTA